MNGSNTKQGRHVRGTVFGSLMLAVVVIFVGAAGAIQAANPGVLPPHSNPYGKSYAEWSANWWQWFLEQPVVGGPTDPNFDIRAGQTGNGDPDQSCAYEAHGGNVAGDIRDSTEGAAIRQYSGSRRCGGPPDRATIAAPAAPPRGRTALTTSGHALRYSAA